MQPTMPLPPEGDPVIYRARQEFLDAIARVAPDALDQLENTVLRHYPSDPRLSFQLATDIEALMALAPNGPAFQAELDAWASRWNLNCPWMRSTALRTAVGMYAAEHSKHRRDKLMGWHPPFANPQPLSLSEEMSMDVVFRLEEWLDLSHEIEPRWTREGGDTWERFDQEVLTPAFNNYKTWYRLMVERQFVERGWTATPGKKRDRSGSPQKHYEWVVDYQVKGSSYKAIAEQEEKIAAARILAAQAAGTKVKAGEVGVSESAVRKAVRSTAALIGIPLRKGPAKKSGK